MKGLGPLGEARLDRVREGEVGGDEVSQVGECNAGHSSAVGSSVVGPGETPQRGMPHPIQVWNVTSKHPNAVWELGCIECAGGRGLGSARVQVEGWNGDPSGYHHQDRGRLCLRLTRRSHHSSLDATNTTKQMKRDMDQFQMSKHVK